MPDSRIKRMVKVLLDSCQWESVIKQNNKGNTFLHIAVTRGNETFTAFVLQTLFEVYTEDQIKSLLNTRNNNEKSVADASRHNRDILLVVKEWKGEHNLPPPAAWAFNNQNNPGASKDHRWHRHNPNHHKNLKRGLRPEDGDTCHNKDGDGDWSACGAKESDDHWSGWGDKGGTDDSRCWCSSEWRSASSIDHNQWQGPRKSQVCARPRSRSRVYCQV